MRCFLTGHKGLIGSNLLIRLIDLGHEVHYDMKVFEIYKWDLIIHLAATTNISTEFNPMIYENNIIFAKKMLSTPYRTIYASSCSAQYNTNPYAASKIYNEWLGEKHGNAIGVRFYNIFGNPNTKGIVWFLMNQKDGAKITIRGPELVRDYLHVSDAVDKLMYLVDAEDTGKTIKENRIIHLGSGVPTATMDVVNLYMKLSGKMFNIYFSEAGNNEPKEMVSPYTTLCLSLEEGLLKTINNEKRI